MSENTPPVPTAEELENARKGIAILQEEGDLGKSLNFFVQTSKDLPELTANIALLKQSQADAVQQLADTNASVTDKKSELAAKQAELNAAQVTLDKILETERVLLELLSHAGLPPIVIPPVVVPVITLRGVNPQTVQQPNMYTEPGATSSDGATVAITGTVPDTPGDYDVNYNTPGAVQVTRKVTVVAAAATGAAPTITITPDAQGNVDMTVHVDDIFTDPGATAVDAAGNPLEVTSAGIVNTTILGEYERTYDATDAAGTHATQQKRKVSVVIT